MGIFFEKPPNFVLFKYLFGSELSKANNEPTFRLHQKNWHENREKIRKIIFGSELSETNNESTFRFLNFWHQFKTIKNGEKLFLAQNCLNRIMSQLLDYTKKDLVVIITEYFMNIYPISNFAPFPTAFCFTKINEFKGLRRLHNWYYKQMVL